MRKCKIYWLPFTSLFSTDHNNWYSAFTCQLDKLGRDNCADYRLLFQSFALIGTDVVSPCYNDWQERVEMLVIQWRIPRCIAPLDIAVRQTQNWSNLRQCLYRNTDVQYSWNICRKAFNKRPVQPVSSKGPQAPAAITWATGGYRMGLCSYYTVNEISRPLLLVKINVLIHIYPVSFLYKWERCGGERCYAAGEPLFASLRLGFHLIFAVCVAWHRVEMKHQTLLSFAFFDLWENNEARPLKW